MYKPPLLNPDDPVFLVPRLNSLPLSNPNLHLGEKSSQLFGLTSYPCPNDVYGLYATVILASLDTIFKNWGDVFLIHWNHEKLDSAELLYIYIYNIMHIIYIIQNYLDQTSWVFFQISLQIVKGKSNIILTYVVPSVKSVLFPFMLLTSFHPSKFSWAITTSGKSFWTSQTRFGAVFCSCSSWFFSVVQEAAAHL